MPAKKVRIPSYRFHRARNLAVVTIQGRDVYLGPYRSPQSHAEYRRVIGEFLACGHVASRQEEPSVPTINELLVPYLEHASGYYVKDGVPTSQVLLIKLALRVVREHYGHTLAKDFGPLALRSVRDAFIRQGLARTEVNRRTSLVKQFIKWATEHELIPPSVFHGLQAVGGLLKGRTDAHETKSVKPVPDAHVDAVLPHVSPQIAVMVELQRLTGMRPAEVIGMRTGDLNMVGPVWEYRPGHHKTEHHDKARVVMLGPRAQGLLRAWLRPALTEHLFRPDEAEQARLGALRASRKSPLWPSHVKAQAAKRKPRRKRSPGDRYTVGTYRNAIHRGCRKAGCPEWSPNQIRHATATRLRRELGNLDSVRTILGHSDLDTSAIYAEADSDKAREIMLKLG